MLCNDLHKLANKIFEITQKTTLFCTIKLGQIPHEKINQCWTNIDQHLLNLININQYLTNIEYQFYKILVILVLSVISIKYGFTQICTLVNFNR